eukprot:4707435-Amphidinium_carterae.1
MIPPEFFPAGNNSTPPKYVGMTTQGSRATQSNMASKSSQDALLKLKNKLKSQLCGLPDNSKYFKNFGSMNSRVR